jgi:hypothetical protein
MLYQKVTSYKMHISGTSAHFSLNYLENWTIIKSVRGIKCVRRSSLQLLLEAFFTLIYILRVRREKRAYTHTGLYVKCLLSLSEPKLERVDRL